MSSRETETSKKPAIADPCEHAGENADERRPHHSPASSKEMAAAARAVLRARGGAGAVELCRGGAIATLTLANSHERNALTPAMMCGLADAVDELEADSTSVALLLRGAAGSFCAGASFSIFEEATSEKALREVGAAMRSVMVDTTDRLHRLPQVSASLIEGHAIGGGAELATCTDFRIWAPSAQLRFVQSKMGLTPGWGGGARLVAMVGRRQALLLLGTGQPLSYAGAREMGLADACATSDSEADAESAATAFLGAFARQPFHAVVRAMKEVVTAPQAGAEERAFLELWGGPSNLEAVRAVRDRRGR